MTYIWEIFDNTAAENLTQNLPQVKICSNCNFDISKMFSENELNGFYFIYLLSDILLFWQSSLFQTVTYYSPAISSTLI